MQCKGCHGVGLVKHQTHLDSWEPVVCPDCGGHGIVTLIQIVRGAMRGAWLDLKYTTRRILR